MNDVAEATAPLLKTPLHAWHTANGGKLINFGGWDMPVQYASGILKEHLATRRFGGLFDVSHMGRFRIHGKDTIPFLQHVLTNNAESLEPWQAQYTLIPNENGGLLDDAYLYHPGDEYFLVVNASNREKDWNHFQEQAEAFDVRLEDETNEVAMIAFQGPLSGRILSEVKRDGRMPETFRNSLSEMTILGTKLLVARTGYTGEPIGFEVFVPADKAEAIWARLEEAGKDEGVVAAGLGARDTLRLEAGMTLYGHEFGLDPEGKEIPAFAFPLTSVAVSFSRRKGEFVGRAALRTQFEEVRKLRMGQYELTDVLPRRFLPLALRDKGITRQGDTVHLDGQQVGVITSGTMVPYWRFQGEGATMQITDGQDRRALALAYVDATVPAEQELEIEVRGRRLNAQLVRWHGRSEAPPYFRAIPVDWKAKDAVPAPASSQEQIGLLLKKSVENHEWRQRRCINLIPSEMTQSSLVRLLQITDPCGRYAEHKELLAAFEQEVFYYQGTEFIAWAEDRLVEEMQGFLGYPLVETRVISGQMANMTIFSALVDFGNRTERRSEPSRIPLVMNNHIGKGGHLSSQPMGALRDYVAKDPVTEKYAVLNFPVRQDNPYRIDLGETANLLDRFDPELIILGKSMILHPEPVAAIRKMLDAKSSRPVLMYDMAHVLGLIGPHFQNPHAEGADIITGSTHKTFYGSQRGVIGVAYEEATPEFELWKAIQRRAFPGAVSNHHLGTLLGLLMAALEMNAFKETYQPQVIANAKAFAKALADKGLEVQGDPEVGYTETHQVVVVVGYAQGCAVAQELEESNIILNFQAVPSDESFTSSSGLRMGVAEMTRFGMKEDDFREFAPLFVEAVQGKNVGEEIARFRERFQTMHYCFDTEFSEVRSQLAGLF
ncbi:MAG TPA: glycine cleavage system aminomethyltransferase GcvT [Deltaproteobacteria bacterium]|nr:glycine cleavage system aminomethyltransferase GcvT [Deltaproteobacteria bacterium]